MSEPNKQQPRWFVLLMATAACSPVAILAILAFPWLVEYATPFIGRALLFTILAGAFCGSFAGAYNAPKLLEKTRWWFRSRKAERSLSKTLKEKVRSDYQQAEAETAAMATAAYATSTQTVTSKKPCREVERMVQKTSQRVLESRLNAIDAVVEKYTKTQELIANSDDIPDEEKAKLYKELEDLAAFPELADAFEKQRKQERKRKRKEKERKATNEKKIQDEKTPVRPAIALRDRWEPVIKLEDCYEVLTESGPKLVPARKYRTAAPTADQLAAELNTILLSDEVRKQQGYVVRFESLTDATPWRAFHQEYHAVGYLLRLALVKIPDQELHERMEDEFLKLSAERQT